MLLKKAKLTYLLFCISSFIFIEVSGQKMNIGETVPDVNLSRIINYYTGTAKISDFRGKLLILDFWETTCTPCISNFPRMDSLRRSFAGSLEILPVTYESEARVKTIFESLLKAKNVQAFSIVENKSLMKMFPYTTVPHYVWINSMGKVIAITSDNDVTTENIRKVLKGEPVNFSLKKEIKWKAINADQPLFLLANSEGAKTFELVNEERVELKSIMTRYLEGIQSFTNIDSSRITASNLSALNLLKFVFFKTLYAGGNVKVLVNDSALYYKLTASGLRGQDYRQWASNNAWCYELVVPSALVTKKWELAQREVGLFFEAQYGLRSSIALEEVPSLVLVRTSSVDKIKTKGGARIESFNKYRFTIQNASLKWLVVQLRHYWQVKPFPIVDETNYQEFVDIELNGNMASLEEVNKALEKYDLKFVTKNNQQLVLTIRQVEKN